MIDPFDYVPQRSRRYVDDNRPNPRRRSRREMQGLPPIDERDYSNTYSMIDDQGNYVDVPTWDLHNPLYHDTSEREAILAKLARERVTEVAVDQAEPKRGRRRASAGEPLTTISKI
jgi:hypothetical protein